MTKTHTFSSNSHSHHYLYQLWCYLKQKCLNRKYKDFKHYGGRGIGIYNEWKEFVPFKNYVISKIGDRPTRNHTLDRINNDEGY